MRFTLSTFTLSGYQGRLPGTGNSLVRYDDPGPREEELEERESREAYLADVKAQEKMDRELEDA
jgi:hypothetical protein